MSRGTNRAPKMHRTPTKTKLLAQGNTSLSRAIRNRTAPVLACTSAVASLLSPASSLAVSLGELRVQSALGQPLQAIVPVELAAGESMGAGCLSAAGSSNQDLATVPGAEIQTPEISNPGAYEVRITTAGPLYEPMYALALQVKCPGTALMVRQYVLMLDLPGSGLREATAALPAATAPVVANPSAIAGASSETVETPQAKPNPVRRGHRALQASAESISKGTTYRVREGDTLSTIAARVSDRGSPSLWRFADQIFAANPAAFIGGNRDIIKLGSEIIIPTGTVAPSETAAIPQPVPTQAIPAPAPAAATEPPAPPLNLPTTAADNTVSEAPADAVPATPADAEAPVGSVFADTANPPAPAPPVRPAIQANRDGENRATSATAPPIAQAESHPLLAAGVGLLLGAGLSLLLLRRRLIDALGGIFGRGSSGAQTGSELRAAAAVESLRKATPAPVKTRTTSAPESTMVVVESQPAAADDTTDNVPVLANPAPAPLVGPNEGRTGTMAARVDLGLASLFDDSGLTAELPDTALMPTMEAPVGALDLDLTGAMEKGRGGQAVEDIGWLGDDNDLTRTQKSEFPDLDNEVTAPQMDLNSLAKNDTNDEKLSDTLRDALALLERDYEDEFSASQVIDLKANPQPASEDDDDTLLRTGTDRNRRG